MEGARIVLAAAVITTIATPVGSQTAPRTTRPASLTQPTFDVSQFIQDSINWVRDSIVLDSISRTIRTDSLFRLYRAQLRETDPLPLEQAINCESSRLFWLYGSNAAVDALRRMEDTLYHPSDRADRIRVSNRLHSLSVQEMFFVNSTQRTCGRYSLWGPQHPTSVGGTYLSGRTGRPSRVTWRPGTSPAAVARSADSVKYVKDSTKWVRDSVAVDSISRTINTDSLFRLLRAQLHAEKPVPLQGAVDCETARLEWKYGSSATKEAYRRMHDTLYRSTDSADMKRVADRLVHLSPQEMASVGVGERQCGKFSNWGPLHPGIVDASWTMDRPARPTRPIRPDD
jgi:hypothetical protein